MRILLALIVSALSLHAQSIFTSGVFSSVITPGGPAAGGGGAPGDGYESSLFAYYACEDSGNTGLHDSTAGARNWSLYSGSQTGADATGKIGQGYTFGLGSPTLDFRYGSSTAFNFSPGHSFTLRFWIKTSATGANDNLIGPAGPWEVLFGSPPSGGDSKIDFQLNGASLSFDLVSTAIGDGNWHEIFCWFDLGSGVAGIQVDNNSPTTQSSVDMYDPGSGQFFDFNGTPGTLLTLDEIAFWDNYVLTSGDRTFDWNGGDGEGFPLP